MFSITYINIMNIYTTKPKIGAKGFNACLIIMYGLHCHVITKIPTSLAHHTWVSKCPKNVVYDDN